MSAPDTTKGVHAIYIAIREDIMSRQTMVSTMINGWRHFKDSRL